MGPAFAATLAEPAFAPYYVHPTWPGTALCNESALILRDYAAAEPYGWVAAADASNAAVNNSTPSNPQQQQQQQDAVYGGDVDTVNGSYAGSFIVHYANSSLLCERLLTAADCPGLDPGNVTACIAAAYLQRDPDRLMEPGSAAYAAASAGQQQQSGRNYGLSVVLPAVLASVLGARGTVLGNQLFDVVVCISIYATCAVHALLYLLSSLSFQHACVCRHCWTSSSGSKQRLRLLLSLLFCSPAAAASSHHASSHHEIKADSVTAASAVACAAAAEQVQLPWLL
jgi:hypothetical protein